jgi:hypothetical protein
MQLEKFIKGCPGFVEAYSSVPKTPFCQDDGLFPADQYPQLVPHRDLDASSLRLSGEGKWPMERYLQNCLWLPFQEPAFLRHGLSLEGACVPSFKYESNTECLKLAKLWDCRGLLSLFGAPLAPGYFCKVFQVYKTPECDLQIGDRRLPNASEFQLDGPSKFASRAPSVPNACAPRRSLRFRVGYG